MPSKLPINVEDLLRQRTVEGDRIEYKRGWNPDPIIQTLCAFANDFENLGGGYVVIGQDCDKNGRPVFPPEGLHDDQLDRIQRELLGYCNSIRPPYFPALSIETFQRKKLLVLWAPGGQNRPYKAPRAVTARHKTHHYYNGIKIEALNGEKIVARRYRNRRIGEFLKELKLTEGRCTGVPTMRKAMRDNGSPRPKFSTDEARTHFLVELPVHPEMQGIVKAHDRAHEEAHDRAHDELNDTERRILVFLNAGLKVGLRLQMSSE